MHLTKLNLFNFRNYEEAHLEFKGDVFCLLGKNGSGKTNLLDAIHYLSFTKSFLNTSDAVNVRNGESVFSIKGTFENQGRENEVFCSYQPGAKKLMRENGNDYIKLSGHIGKYPVVLIAPNDIELIWDGSEVRRKFVDGLISQINSQYLEHLITYTNHLKARNAALRQFAERGRTDHDLLATYDRVLSKSGDFIYQTRTEFVLQLLPVLQKFYQFLSSGNEPAEVAYKSDLEALGTAQIFQQNLQRDLVLQRTSAGIHRDDFTFQLNGFELKKYGSQGQQKSFLISLKLAEFEIIEQQKGFKPILLLDDIFDKLDDDRIQKLIELIARQTFGQIFITDARPDRTSEILRKANLTASLLTVDNGIVRYA